ncbi:hypothetical protein ACIQNU_02475 [Streptomyces sp. NPDC091292]|uniref:hypothetical protein n=1 Tax=Streptomyces sp. NPDC091292 TaxID=3365991 RepID=UPI003800025F
MRSTRNTTTQTTCDYEASDCTRCDTYMITASQTLTAETRAARHREDLAADGWTDHEGRDYCPDHPVGSGPASAVRP